MANRRAFTLIELLVVISIIALLSSVVLASLNAAREKARVAAGRQFSGNLYRAAADSAVAVWEFEECSGATAADRSGNGNVGTLANGPTWPTDTQSGTGCSVQLDGSNDYMTAGNVVAANFGTGDFSVSFWMRSSSARTEAVINKRAVCNYASWWEVELRSSGRIGLTIDESSSGNFNSVSSAELVNDDRWHHVALTRSGTQLGAYVDGRQSATATTSIVHNLSNSGGLDISNHPCIGSDGRQRYTGKLDSVQVFAKALTAHDVRQMYAAEAPRFGVASR